MKRVTVQKLNFNVRDKFIDDMAQNYYWINDEILGVDWANKMLNYAHSLADQGKFVDSGIKTTINDPNCKKLIRGDEIYWIDEWKHPSLSKIKKIVEEICLLSQRYLFLPAYYYNGHFAVYPPDHQYQLHADKSSTGSSRLLTLILYLSDLSEADGGALVLYDDLSRPIHIQPQKGRLVVFDSSIEHEVKVTLKERWSLVVWLCQRSSDFRVSVN